METDVVIVNFNREIHVPNSKFWQINFPVGFD